MTTTPKLKFDLKGRLFCPTCNVRVKDGPDPKNYLNIGVGQCPAGHQFVITADIAAEVNTLWDKLLGVSIDRGVGKDFIRNQGDSSPKKEDEKP